MVDGDVESQNKSTGRIFAIRSQPDGRSYSNRVRKTGGVILF